MAERNGVTPSRNGRSGVLALVRNWLAARIDLMRRWLDPRRDLNYELGFPEFPDSDVYQQLYEREAIAARVVELFPKECFQVSPEIYEDEDPEAKTAWEEALDKACERLAGWSWHKEQKGSRLNEVFRRADVLSGVASYGVVLVGIDDDRPLSVPADLRRPPEGGSWAAPPAAEGDGRPASDRASGGATPSQPPAAGDGLSRNLTFLQVFPEYYATVLEYEQDERSPRFGLPLLYSIAFGDSRRIEGAAMPMTTRQVHWSRVVHLVDVSHQPPANEVYGASRQRAVLNNLLSLRKVYGPDAESYYKNGIPGWAFETHPELGAVDLDKDSLKDDWEEYSNSVNARVLATEGGQLKPLVTTVTDPRPHVEIQVEAICIKLGVPVRIFKGSERGELASSQDDAAWNDRVRERQHNYLTPRLICPIIDRLIALGVLPVPENADGYKVYWPDLESQGQAEKATIAATRATALATVFDPTKELWLRMPPENIYTWVFGMTEGEAKQVVAAAEAEKEKARKEAEAAAAEQAKQQQAAADDAHQKALELTKAKQPDPAARAAAIEARRQGAAEAAAAEQTGAVAVGNVFCPTGAGGGVDPTCTAGGGRGYESVKRQVERHLDRPDARNLEGLSRALGHLSRAELGRLKQETGLRAGGRKAEQVAALARQVTASVTEAERYAREARALGHSREALAHTARQFRDLHNEQADRVNALVRDARKSYESLTGRRLTRNNPAFDRGDPTQLREWDVVTRGLAGDAKYSDLLHDAGYRGGGRSREQQANQTLFDLVRAGPVPRMTYRQANEAAIRELRERPVQRRRESQPAGAEEPFTLF